MPIGLLERMRHKRVKNGVLVNLAFISHFKKWVWCDDHKQSLTVQSEPRQLSLYDPNGGTGLPSTLRSQCRYSWLHKALSHKYLQRHQKHMLQKKKINGYKKGLFFFFKKSSWRVLKENGFMKYEWKLNYFT